MYIVFISHWILQIHLSIGLDSLSPAVSFLKIQNNIYSELIQFRFYFIFIHYQRLLLLQQQCSKRIATNKHKPITGRLCAGAIVDDDILMLSSSSSSMSTRKKIECIWVTVGFDTKISTVYTFDFDIVHVVISNIVCFISSFSPFSYENQMEKNCYYWNILAGECIVSDGAIIW